MRTSGQQSTKRARIVRRPEFTRDWHNQEVMSRGHAVVEGPVQIGPMDHMELKDGLQPANVTQIVNAAHFPDESGATHHAKVWF